MHNDHELPMFIENLIAPYFVKANKQIIENNQVFLDETQDRYKLLQKEWLENYGAELVVDSKTSLPIKIKFKDLHSKTIFLLKFN